MAGFKCCADLLRRCTHAHMTDDLSSRPQFDPARPCIAQKKNKSCPSLSPHPSPLLPPPSQPLYCLPCQVHVLNGEKYKEICPDNVLLSHQQLKACVISHHTKALLRRDSMPEDALRCFLQIEVRGQGRQGGANIVNRQEVVHMQAVWARLVAVCDVANKYEISKLFFLSFRKSNNTVLLPLEQPLERENQKAKTKQNNQAMLSISTVNTSNSVAPANPCMIQYTIYGSNNSIQL